MNERGRDGANSEWVFLNSVVAAVQCQRAATGAAKVENGANKANRQLKVRPYATMAFGSISADVQAKNKPNPVVLIWYYPRKKDHHRQATMERPHPTGGSCPREGHGHGKGKLIRILFSVYFGGFRG